LITSLVAHNSHKKRRRKRRRRSVKKTGVAVNVSHHLSPTKESKMNSEFLIVFIDVHISSQLLITNLFFTYLIVLVVLFLLTLSLLIQKKRLSISIEFSVLNTYLPLFFIIFNYYCQEVDLRFLNMAVLYNHIYIFEFYFEHLSLPNLSFIFTLKKTKMMNHKNFILFFSLKPFWKWNKKQKLCKESARSLGLKFKSISQLHNFDKQKIKILSHKNQNKKKESL
jgi:energy-coupling factor transporter transmembrane protein EcfT